MSEQEVTPEATPTSGGKRGPADAIKTILQEVIGQKEEEWTQDMVNGVGALLNPDRGKVPEIQNRKGETVIRLVSPTEHLYRKMSDEEREWRTPESDHYMAEEFRALATNDRARWLASQAALNAQFGRGTTAEGLAAASGAYSTGTGGTLISRPVEALVLIAKERVSKMPRFASSFTMTKMTHTVPTGAAMSAYQTLEGGTTTVGEPIYAAVQLSAVKAGVRGIVTLEQLDDSDVNVVSFMTTRAGMALGALQEAQYWRTGDGTEPNISAFAAGVTYTPATTATALDYSSVVDCYHTLTQVYRTNAAWYSASDVLGFLSNVRSANGSPFYQGLADAPLALTDDPNAMGTILGKPVYEVDATAGTIHFGDMSQLYLIGSRAGVTARMSDQVGFATGTVQFIWEQRYDGNNVDTSACQTMTGITSANSL
jgi:HK97 family phage major capsid protein